MKIREFFQRWPATMTYVAIIVTISLVLQLVEMR